MTVAIVTDSAAALPAELAAHYGVSVVPLLMTTRGRTTRDGEVPVAALIDADDLETSGPSPGDFTNAIGDRMSSDGVLVLTLASSMSSTYQSAALAGNSTDGPVRVIDTQTAAGAEALVVLAAARAAANGASLDAVARVAEDVIARVRLVATVPSLEHLARSGRVPGLAEWVGRKLRVAPLFEFASGTVRSLRPALGIEAAYERMVHLVLSSHIEGARLHVAAYHALVPDAAARLLEELAREITPASTFVGEFSSVMVAHTGPGLVGLAWWWQDTPGGG
jgi:DegV family protein with EDD domain